MKSRRKNGVFEAIRMAAVTHRLLTAGTVLCAAASVAASLVPPLLLARIIDGLTAGLPLTFPAVLLYFGSLALEGMLSSAQEGLLVLFGQKMTHALRAEMSRKLTRLPAGRPPLCPARSRKHCTTSAPSGLWVWKATWSIAMTGASAKAMPRWSGRIFMTRSIRPSCWC